MNAKPINILLADDDTDDCMFFENALEKLAMPTHLTIVHDGDELMELLVKETTVMPDVVFLDLNMPRKSGFECLTEMKQNSRLKNLPVIIFSTSSSRDNMEMLFKNGAHIYIRKPGDFEQLKEVIHHALPLATRGLSPNSQIKYILNA